jgi:putative ABC transport system permease protein
VVGVLTKKGGMGPMNPDDAVYIPVPTAMRRLLGQRYVSNITCQARDSNFMTTAETEIGTLLQQRHKIASPTDDDFIIFNQGDLMEAQNEQQNTFATLITYLAAVSLIVGGIGIMNIMLVSVTERTREIGVRKAIGATRHDVLTQFLLEAVLLSLVGGILGVLAGIGSSDIVEARNGWTVVIAPETVILAFGCSAIIGIFFGFYPALKASKLNPIDALRYE